MKITALLYLLLATLSCFSSANERLIPQKPSFRVIVDNDFAGDPDGLAALAHQVLTPKTKTVLVTISATNPEFSKMTNDHSDTAVKGKNRVIELFKLIDIADIPVIAGNDLLNYATKQKPSLAAQAIVKEAMRDDPLPLLFTCGGPLTNLAEALILEPEIAKRMTVIWIGGGNYPAGGWEYNLATDLAAARTVLEQSTIPVWQIPLATYRQVQYSVAEMRSDFKPISPVTNWLYSLYTDLPEFVELGGSLTMGDHPLVLLSALSSESSVYIDRPARHLLDDFSYGEEISNRTVRVFNQVDTRLTLADFIATLRIQAQTE